MSLALSRREFLRLSGLSASLAALSSCLPISEALQGAKVSQLPAAADTDGYLLHLLRRTTFGPSAGDLAQARQLGAETWLEHQLQTPVGDPPDIHARLARFETLNRSPAELADLDDLPHIARELVASTLIRQIFSPHQLYEQMVDFWTNHFNIYLREGPVVLFKGWDDREVVRRHALGKFPDLLRASAHSPAMLVYLDNAQSRSPSPNENYARELLELHSLGVGSGYTHHDVEQVALAFTGWTLSRMRGGGDGSFLFLEPWHDRGEKHVLDLHLIDNGQAEGELLLDYLAGHPATARNIASKLCRRMVSDSPSSSLVEAVAGVYRSTQGDIPSMLRAIFGSAEFAAASGRKLKRALDYVISVLRTATTGEGLTRQVFQYLQVLGQIPFAWPAPDGYPEQASAWNNTNQCLYRWNLALSLTAGDLRGVELALPTLAEAPESWVDAGSQTLLGAELPSPARSILNEVISGMPTPQASAVLSGLILASPYFQLR